MHIYVACQKVIMPNTKFFVTMKKKIQVGKEGAIELYEVVIFIEPGQETL